MQLQPRQLLLGAVSVVVISAVIAVVALQPTAVPQAEMKPPPAEPPPVEPPPVAEVAVQPFAPRGCTFSAGEQAAWSMRTEVVADIDLGKLLSSTGSAVLAEDVEPPQQMKCTTDWRLDVTAIGPGRDGGVVLAAWISQLKQVVDDDETPAMPGSDSLFLIELGPQCAIARFGWARGAVQRAVKAQQRLVAPLNWRLRDGERRRFAMTGRDAIGEHSANVAVTGDDKGAVVRRKKLSYSRLFKVGGWLGHGSQARVTGPGLRARVGAGLWFDEVRHEETVITSQRGNAVSKVRTVVKANAARPDPTPLVADPNAAHWLWGDLFERDLRPAQRAQLREVAEGKGVDLQPAIDALLRQVVGAPASIEMGQ